MLQGSECQHYHEVRWYRCVWAFSRGRGRREMLRTISKIIAGLVIRENIGRDNLPADLSIPTAHLESIEPLHPERGVERQRRELFSDNPALIRTA